MKVLINALSVTNASGRHVLLGHLSRFAAATQGRHEFVVLFHSVNRDLCRDLGPNVSWVEAPPVTVRWFGRAVWEAVNLGRMAKQFGCQVVYSPAGIVTPGLGLPQVSFAQNPWALVRDLERSPIEHAKAAVQRRAYREAMQRAEVMVFNSHYMHAAYRANAGHDAQAARIIYQGVDDETFAAAEERNGRGSRRSLEILSVSVMARHKGVETLVSALSRLHREHGIPAKLRLVGEWPDAAYRTRIEAQVRELGLHSSVAFEGHVSRDALYDAYASAQVFALMSRCESFGIPAVEAQAFGTPVVSSDCCAIPEICGDGGLFPGVDRDDEAAAALARLLTDDGEWSARSDAARANVESFRWDVCYRPNVALFDELAGGLPG